MPPVPRGISDQAQAYLARPRRPHLGSIRTAATGRPWLRHVAEQDATLSRVLSERMSVESGTRDLFLSTRSGCTVHCGRR